MARRLRFHLNLPALEYQKYYAGHSKVVHVRADNGQTIQFPADKLLPFVEHAGVSGQFEIVFDDNHQYISLNKLK